MMSFFIFNVINGLTLSSAMVNSPKVEVMYKNTINNYIVIIVKFTSIWDDVLSIRFVQFHRYCQFYGIETHVPYFVIFPLILVVFI